MTDARDCDGGLRDVGGYYDLACELRGWLENSLLEVRWQSGVKGKDKKRR